MSGTSVGTCRGESELKSFCEIVLKEYGTTSLESWHFTLTPPLIIVPKYTIVLFDLSMKKKKNEN